MLSEYFNSKIENFTRPAFGGINLPITWITAAGLKIRYSNIKF